MNINFSKIQNEVPDDIILKFIHISQDGNLLDIIEDTGGAGLCPYVSKEFQEFTNKGEWAWFDLTSGFVKAYPVVNGFHCTTRINDFIFDFTAKQFDEKLPFPYIWDISKTNLIRTPNTFDYGFITKEELIEYD